jgi:hypothetical protein
MIDNKRASQSKHVRTRPRRIARNPPMRSAPGRGYAAGLRRTVEMFPQVQTSLRVGDPVSPQVALAWSLDNLSIMGFDSAESLPLRPRSFAMTAPAVAGAGAYCGIVAEPVLPASRHQLSAPAGVPARSLRHCRAGRPVSVWSCRCPVGSVSRCASKEIPGLAGGSGRVWFGGTEGRALSLKVG